MPVVRPADHEIGVMSHQFPSPWDSPLIRCIYQVFTMMAKIDAMISAAIFRFQPALIPPSPDISFALRSLPITPSSSSLSSPLIIFAICHSKTINRPFSRMSVKAVRGGHEAYAIWGAKSSAQLFLVFDVGRSGRKFGVYLRVVLFRRSHRDLGLLGLIGFLTSAPSWSMSTCGHSTRFGPRC
jgi:hypothetical protein